METFWVHIDTDSVVLALLALAFCYPAMRKVVQIIFCPSGKGFDAEIQE